MRDGKSCKLKYGDYVRVHLARITVLVQNRQTKQDVCSGGDSRSFVVPQERPQILPVLGVTVQIGHRVEHPGLDSFASVSEQPHHCAP